MDACAPLKLQDVKLVGSKEVLGKFMCVTRVSLPLTVRTLTQTTSVSGESMPVPRSSAMHSMHALLVVHVLLQAKSVSREGTPVPSGFGAKGEDEEEEDMPEMVPDVEWSVCVCEPSKERGRSSGGAGRGI
eukprot:scaffold68011_cov21-Tisochrysis_lutea.AAC.1